MRGGEGGGKLDAVSSTRGGGRRGGEGVINGNLIKRLDAARPIRFKCFPMYPRADFSTLDYRRISIIHGRPFEVINRFPDPPSSSPSSHSHPGPSNINITKSGTMPSTDRDRKSVTAQRAREIACNGDALADSRHRIPPIK